MNSGHHLLSRWVWGHPAFAKACALASLLPSSKSSPGLSERVSPTLESLGWLKFSLSFWDGLLIFFSDSRILILWKVTLKKNLHLFPIIVITTKKKKKGIQTARGLLENQPSEPPILVTLCFLEDSGRSLKSSKREGTSRKICHWQLLTTFTVI